MTCDTHRLLLLLVKVVVSNFCPSFALRKPYNGIVCEMLCFQREMTRYNVVVPGKIIFRDNWKVLSNSHGLF